MNVFVVGKHASLRDGKKGSNLAKDLDRRKTLRCAGSRNESDVTGADKQKQKMTEAKRRTSAGASHNPTLFRLDLSWPGEYGQRLLREWEWQYAAPGRQTPALTDRGPSRT
jgi:hypothetical protein